MEARKLFSKLVPKTKLMPHSQYLQEAYLLHMLETCSLMPRPISSHEEMGLVTIEQFLGCAESAVLILNNPMK